MSLENSLLIRAMRGEQTERSPIWLMRQAGRYLPEYRAIRAERSMLDVIRTPELAAEVTLQPLRRFPLDGAIIFADILNPLIGMGLELDFVKGEGPKIFNPVRKSQDVSALKVPPPADNVAYTLEAISRVCEDLNPKGTPLIGFSGAPFTLAAYAVEGETSKRWELTRSFMLSEPAAWHEFQEKLSELVSDYLLAQVEAGVSAVQLFDSWVGILAPAEYEEFCLPYVKKIVSRFKENASVPFVYFAAGATGLYSHIQTIGADVIGVDWRISLTEASNLLDNKFVLQGNLDPALLCHSWERAEVRTKEIISEAKNLPGFVFNLGHGLWKDTPPEHVGNLVSLVRGG